MSENLSDYFDRVMVVNLKRRGDRLTAFREQLRQARWPFRAAEIFEAIDGSALPLPFGWQDGAGAFGCMQSHRHILERAIMDGVERLLVLEDDVLLRSDFAERVEAFLDAVPDDWDQLMLGGQHMGQCDRVRDGVHRSHNCQRTHAYAVRRRYMCDLYQMWISSSGHCDHRMGEIQYRYKVYAPDPFLIGQAGGPSDISGGNNPPKFWTPPKHDQPVIVFNGPRELLEILRGYGLHSGYSRDPETGMDVGLLEVFTKRDRIPALCRWVDMIQWEVASSEGQICTVWHPEATVELVKQACPESKVLLVKASTVTEALQQFAPPVKQPASATTQVVHLSAPRSTVEELRGKGWHFGHWRDEITGADNGLREIALLNGPERRARLGVWIREVGKEAERLVNGVLAIWCDGISAEQVREATLRRVIEVKAKSAEEAIASWEKSLGSS